MIEIKKEQDGSNLTIGLKGVLDTPAKPALEEALKGCYSGLSRLTFDFVELEYITSAGIRVLLKAQNEMDRRNGEMVLIHVSKEIMEVFGLTGFSDVLDIRDSAQPD
jgi:anti-sigma B factor antagonist